MPTCPNCGSIIMEGDPYCFICGTAFRWSGETNSSTGQTPETGFNDVSIEEFGLSLEALNLSANILSGIKKSVDISKAQKGTVFSIRQAYPEDNIEIIFKRKNKYFSTTDNVIYSYYRNRIDGHYFSSNFHALKNAEWFKRAVSRKESETGLKFHDCGGGYDAKYDWHQTNTFALKEGCEVIAHFIENDCSYRGFPVDFKNHALRNDSKSYDRASSRDALSDYDWL